MAPETERTGMELSERLVAGISGGIGWAVFFSLIATVIYALGGEEAFARNDTTYVQTVGIYWIGGLMAGIVVGVLLPLGKWRIGAAVLGSVAMAIVYGSVWVTIDGWQEAVQYAHWIAALALISGPIAGIIMWYKVRNDPL